MEVAQKVFKWLEKGTTWLRGRRGQTLVEYGLILALVSIIIISVMYLLGHQINNVFNTITSTFNNAFTSIQNISEFVKNCA